MAAALRILRSRTTQVPGVAELVLPLAESPVHSVNALAGEILTELGVAVPTRKTADAKSPAAIIQHGPANITMVRIPAGDFMMGSVSGRSNEKPVHSVRVTRDFLLGRYPVTNAQYGEFLKTGGKRVRKPAYWDDRRFNQPEQPVVGVSWDEAQAFCQWADCSLPTGAEWEYACRAGTTTAFSFGDDPEQLDQYGWHKKNSGGQTQPVGTREPNAWGLYDMHGNVWEWCQYWYGEYAAAAEENPSGPENGNGRVLRGGSWGDEAGNCRSSVRNHIQPDNRYYIVIGFRVART